MNNVVLVGRLAENPKVSTTESGNKVTTVNIAVTRNYKNSDGIYETDFIRCVLWNVIAENTSEYCHTGDVIGIKGRIQTSSYEDDNKEKHYVTEVVAEKVTFLSSTKIKDSEDEQVKKAKKKEVKE